MTGRANILAGLLLIGCSDSRGGLAKSSELIGNSHAELMGGTKETEATAVVSIYRQGTFMCTGTLIDPRIVVTAEHCVTKREDTLAIPDVDSATLDAGSAPQSFIGDIDYDVQPQYREAGWPDIAILALEKPASSSVVPIQVHEQIVSIEPGLPVQIAGFGRTVPAEEPTKRRGNALVVDANGDGLLLEGDGCAACFGDSGGPVLENSDGDPRLLAVISSGDAQCTGRFDAARVDTQAETLLASFIARVQTTNGQLGARCVDNQSCESRICSDYGTGLKTCVDSCADGLSCPSGQQCISGEGSKVCRPVTIFGAVGSPVNPTLTSSRRCAPQAWASHCKRPPPLTLTVSEPAKRWRVI